jgi:HK97 family phage major capsid protein
MSELQQKIEQIGHAFEEFKKTHDQRLEAVEKGLPTSDLDQKLQRIENEMNELSSVKERLEKVELQANRIPASSGGDMSTEEKEHLDAFFKWIRNPRDSVAQQELRQKQSTITTSTAATAGNALPEVISRQIEQKLLDMSPMRQICRVENVGTTDYKKLVNVRGAAAAWVGEDSSRSQTDVSSLKQVAPTFGTIYAYPFTTEEALNDLFIDVQNWLVTEASEAISKKEGEAFIDGNGTNKPTGFLSGTPENTGDEESPARTFGELEYLFTGNASGFGELDTGSPGHYPADVMFDTVYALKAGYRGNARWVCNKSTLNTLRKFKDSEGNYIWQPGLQMGQPSQLLGYPVAEMEGMPDVGSNNFPVAFGDFRAGYLICNLVGFRITVDDNITAPGYVKFYIRKRLGGILMNDDAIKVIKCATS